MENHFKLKMEDLGSGIYIVDSFYLNRADYTACYIIEDHGELAIVETNTNYAVPYILEAIKGLGKNPQQVKYVILTHIHLDHAGGAGFLMQSLPKAELLLHPRGSRHMINPEKLIASVKQIYGEEKYGELYGEIEPIPESRVCPVEDGERVRLGARHLSFYDTPGHARHHVVVQESRKGALFSGDAFGIGYPRFKYPQFRLIFPSTSPTQFEPEQALESFDRILSLAPSRILLTHFGVVDNIKSCKTQLEEWIAYSTEIAEQRQSQGHYQEELTKKLEQDLWHRYTELLLPFCVDGLGEEERSCLDMDAKINAQGLVHYLNMEAEKK